MFKASFAFALIVLLISAREVDAATPLPSEEDVSGIQKLCGGGRTDVVPIQASVDAAIKNWKNASAGVDVEVAQKNLAGVLDKVKSDSGLEVIYDKYVDCVEKQVDRWLKREADKEANKTYSRVIQFCARSNKAGCPDTFKNCYAPEHEGYVFDTHTINLDPKPVHDAAAWITSSSPEQICVRADASINKVGQNGGVDATISVIEVPQH